VIDSTINSRAELITYLDAALALEHATIPVYLTAYYSIQSTTNSDAAHILRVTAVEEMLHLTLVANVLNAVGGNPDLTRPGFVPSYPASLPDGEDDFVVDLRPFSPEAVDTFCKIERPRKAPDADSRRLQTRTDAPLLAGSPTAEGIRFFSIGEFLRGDRRGARTTGRGRPGFLLRGRVPSGRARVLLLRRRLDRAGP
jgi:Ferritin-like